jgi:hypothetical protein
MDGNLAAETAAWRRTGTGDLCVRKREPNAEINIRIW